MVPLGQRQFRGVPAPPELPHRLPLGVHDSDQPPAICGRRIYADVRTSISRLRQAKLNEASLRRQILQNVRVAYDNLTSAGQAVAQLRVELAAAKEGYRQSSDNYKAGTGTNVESLIAQDQLLRAEVQLASQEFDEKVAYLTLERMVGDLDLRDPTAKKLAPTTAPATSPKH